MAGKVEGRDTTPQSLARAGWSSAVPATDGKFDPPLGNGNRTGSGWARVSERQLYRQILPTDRHGYSDVVLIGRLTQPR